MLKDRLVFDVCVISRGLLRHNVEILVVEFDYHPLSDRLSIDEPLKMKRRTLTMSQPEANHFLSLIVAVEFDSAFIHIVVVISFSEKFLPLFYKGSQLLPCIS